MRRTKLPPPSAQHVMACLGIAVLLVLTVSVAPSSAQQGEPPNKPDCSYDYNNYISGQTCTPCSYTYNELIARWPCGPCSYTYNELIGRWPCAVYLAIDGPLEYAKDGDVSSRQVTNAAGARPSTPEATTSRDADNASVASPGVSNDSATILAITGSNETTPVAGLLLLGLGSFAIALSRTRRPV